MTLFLEEYFANRMLKFGDYNGQQTPKEVPPPFHEPSTQPMLPEIIPIPEIPTEPHPAEVPEIAPIHEPLPEPAPVEIPPNEEPEEEPVEEPDEDEG